MNFKEFAEAEFVVSLQCLEVSAVGIAGLMWFPFAALNERFMISDVPF